MGLAVIGDRLYMSSYLGLGGNDKGGEVFSMPLGGGPATPFVTGFVAAVIGLAQHDGSLYIGELGGTIYRVKA
jgi:hypothetical protein